jgi:hypothetical protein
VDEFLRLAVHVAMQDKGAEAALALTLLQLPNGAKTAALSKALAEALTAVSGVEVTIYI